MRTNTSAKLPYQKPRLRVIDLAAEEVLQGNCKTAPGGGQRPCGGHGNPNHGYGS